MSKTWKFLISVIGAEAIGSIGVIFTSPNISTWYANLTKPVFNPPNWLFAPAWTILFFLMGWAFYLIWTSKSNNKSVAYFAFGVQFLLNIAWSAIFFGLKSPNMAFYEIIILWLAILWTIVEFHKINKSAAYLLIPYILWVSFASTLNYYVWILN
jgi:tryptophan-rich sensory protein